MSSSPERPLVSCIMPSHNRPPFVAHAIGMFLRQDYPNRELLIVDDGTEPVGHLVPVDPRVRYVRLSRRMTIGAKRSLACEEAAGDLLVHWDDDDWFAPTRLSRQVAPLLAERADMSIIKASLFLDVADMQFWARPEDKLAACGTLAFTRDALRRARGYPDVSFAEDIALVRRLSKARGVITLIGNRGLYVYVRHGGNASSFYASVRDRAGWTRVGTPDVIPPQDVAFYAAMAASAHE